MFKEVIELIIKDVRLNWRERYAIYSLLLYVICTSYVAYLSFEGIINERSWIALFWIIVLFAAMNASLQSFKRELNYQSLFFYTIARPRAIIIAKIIYNSGLLILLNLVSYIIYSTMFQFGLEWAPIGYSWLELYPLGEKSGPTVTACRR